MVFKTESVDISKRSCIDCYYCQSTNINWWCVNKEVVKFRKTQIPDTEFCKFWKQPLLFSNLTWYQRLFNDYHII